MLDYFLINFKEYCSLTRIMTFIPSKIQQVPIFSVRPTFLPIILLSTFQVDIETLAHLAARILFIFFLPLQPNNPTLSQPAVVLENFGRKRRVKECDIMGQLTSGSSKRVTVLAYFHCQIRIQIRTCTWIHILCRIFPLVHIWTLIP